uniref:NADH dehydrogenase [ubiquinone] flavoprotein 3, mitochondrial n=1 Tax=Caenorhabditis tropicalis TaxID=1561998 RepID=A0A1I7USP6_9PELO
MNRLVVISARRMASAAPKTSTGIEHAEKAKQVAGGKPDWSLYKCDDYLKFDKYSYAHAEITMNKARVPQPTNRKADVLPKGFLNVELCNQVIYFAGLTRRETPPSKLYALMEAQKCLINTMFHSKRMRDQFFANPIHAENLRFYLGEFSDDRRKVCPFPWIREMNAAQASEIWFFYNRVAFIATAMDREFQKKWANEPGLIDDLISAVENILGKETLGRQDLNRANEALKTFFNVFCHFHNDVVSIDEKHAKKVTRILREIICSDTVGEDMIMSAIHAISVPPLPIVLSVWCQDPKNTVGEEDDDVIDLVRDYKDMHLTEAILMALDRQLKYAIHLLNTKTPVNGVNTEANTVTDLCGPYFQALARLCVESKHARRYCRIRVSNLEIFGFFGENAHRVKDEKKIRQEMSDVLRQITASVSFLPCLEEPVSFDVLIYTGKETEAPEDWTESGACLIPNHETVQLRSFSTSVHGVNTNVQYKADF